MKNSIGISGPQRTKVENRRRSVYALSVVFVAAGENISKDVDYNVNVLVYY